MPGQHHCMECLPFFIGDWSWQRTTDNCPSIVSWQCPASPQDYASAKSTPPDTKECCPFIVCWWRAALCQHCHCKEGPPLTQRRVHCLVLCHGDALWRAPHHDRSVFLFCKTTCSYYWITFFPHINSVAQEPCHAHWHSTPSLIVSFLKVSMDGLAMFLSLVVVMGIISYFIILSISLTNLHFFPNLFLGIDTIRLSPSPDTLLW